MKKPGWLRILSLENHEKTQSFKILMNKFLVYCKEHGYHKGSDPHIVEFLEQNKVGPLRRKLLIGILELRNYIKGKRLDHNIDVIEDNFKFRTNKLSYLIQKIIKRREPKNKK
ncbi:MAG: hypothetical protein ORN24_02135 [Burkholderiales bacterium]|nr:hypothetical protein [Burkholderiales bacterium]